MPDTSVSIQEFITRWKQSGAAERANYGLFLTELCDVIGVERPQPTQPEEEKNTYVFEKAVYPRRADGKEASPNFIDLYKRGCFVLEAKQGAEKHPRDMLDFTPKKLKVGHGLRGSAGWDVAMTAARHQAEGYAKALPVAEGWPPFILVVDVGHVIEIYADFSGTGKVYQQFPDAQNFRIYLDDVKREDLRERLRLIWTDPFALDPARRSAAVTREVADRLATLARSLESDGHEPQTVAGFLMRCLFTMFAEDVGLLPKDVFSELLAEVTQTPDTFRPMVESLWVAMDKGEFSPIIKKKLLRFNGGLFANRTALPLREKQIALLLQAAKADWRDVEPRIFGTLLERALDPKERHKLGAHFTPRAYVERLIEPTLMEPLREQWENAKAAALVEAGKGDLKSATERVKTFHRLLCNTKVLDPACGSGDFLYVALEYMKRLEGEVLTLLEDFGVESRGLELSGLTVDPHQFLGIEVNPRAASIADLVLWIGYLQWHFRSRGKVNPPEPVLKDFKNIACRDALLSWERVEIATDQDGKPLSRWDGETMKTHPATGEPVPDETARIPQMRYIAPERADWPKADYVVGNPPFIGASRIRENLGDGYAEVLWETYAEVGQSTDFVMFWWHRAAELVRAGAIRRFGFITTSSIHQTFNRRVLEAHLSGAADSSFPRRRESSGKAGELDPRLRGGDKMEPLSIHYAIPDHPWVDNADGAAVRIAMSVARAGSHPGTLALVVQESRTEEDTRQVQLAERKGRIHSNLRMGADVASALSLKANENLGSRGVQLMGSGFIVTPEEATKLGLGRIKGLEQHIRHYRNGRDINIRSRGVMVIDLFGLTETEVRERYPDVFQWVAEKVKPERDTNRRDSYRNNWWIHGEPRRAFRPALLSLPRYIATVETTLQRTFMFLDADILPDNKIVAIALDDAYYLGVLQCKIHVLYALAAGGRIGVSSGPVYVKTKCFDTFPFPEATEAQQARIRELAERLDAHRKQRQALHPDLTMTGMYNVLDKLRAGEALSPKERELHEQAATTVLKELHDDLDAAVFAAYGWPASLTDEEILERLVALNHERAREESEGLIRWLRPDYQNPKGGRAATQTEADFGEDEPVIKATPPTKRPWPTSLPEQVQALREVLSELAAPADEATLAKAFKGSSGMKTRLAEILVTLELMGGATRTDEGKWEA